MFNKFKALKHSTQAAIIGTLLFTVSIVAYAAITGLLTQSWTSELRKGDLFEMELNQGAVSGEVVPGSTVVVSPTITNKSTKDAMAFIKVIVPGYGGAGTPAYSYEISSGWTLVEDNGAEKVYGYHTVLGPMDETGVLTDEMVMSNMSTSEFVGLSSVDFSFVGYLADCDEYGRDVEAAWSLISSGD